MQRIAFHPGTEFDDGTVSDLLQQTLEDLPSQIGMRHFTAAKEDRGFYLVALFEEAQHVVLFELVIVLVHVDAELYFLDVDDFLVLLGRALLLLFFIKKLAVILNAADGRVSGSRDLYQVKSSFTGNFERLKGLHDAKLRSVFVDHADFAGANTLISANKALVDTFLRGNLGT